MFEVDKIHNIIKKMKSILEIKVMRWPGSEQYIMNCILYYAGKENINHRNGVAIILSKEVVRTISSVMKNSDRIIIKNLKVNINIIQVYGPKTN